MFRIGKRVEEIGDYCFANANELMNIKGLGNDISIGENCFMNCPKLRTKVEEECKNSYIFKPKEQEYIEIGLSRKFGDVLFDSFYDPCIKNHSKFNHVLDGKKDLLIVFEESFKNVFCLHIKHPINFLSNENGGSVATKKCHVIRQSKMFQMREGRKKFKKFILTVRFYPESNEKLIDIAFGQFVVFKHGKMGYFFKDCDLFELDDDESDSEEIDETKKMLFTVRRIQIIQMIGKRKKMEKIVEKKK